MRDVIWTLIIIWLVYKLVDLFKSVTTTKREYVHTRRSGPAQTTNTPPKKDIHSAMRKHLNNEGEYVDFEEVK